MGTFSMTPALARVRFSRAPYKEIIGQRSYRVGWDIRLVMAKRITLRVVTIRIASFQMRPFRSLPLPLLRWEYFLTFLCRTVAPTHFQTTVKRTEFAMTRSASVLTLII